MKLDKYKKLLRKILTWELMKYESEKISFEQKGQHLRYFAGKCNCQEAIGSHCERLIQFCLKHHFHH